MTGNSLKDEILNSIDDQIIADKSKDIKAVYFERQNATKTKKSNAKWGVLGGILSAGVACAVIIPIALDSNNAGNQNTIPNSVNKQMNDISFGVSSISQVLSASFAQSQAESTQKAAVLKRGGGPGEMPEPWRSGEPEDTTNYLTSVESMYELINPYLSTVDALLNGADFQYEVEASGDETYPYKLSNFIFNIIEEKDKEGDVEEEETVEETNEEQQTLNRVNSLNEEPEEEPEQEDKEEFKFIREYYLIEGLLIVDEQSYPVEGVQITYGRETPKDNEQCSELYLTAQKDEDHEVTIYKSTYSESFTNSFKNTVVSAEYNEECYAYTESELTTVQTKHGTRIERDIINAIEIETVSASKTVNDQTRSDSAVYMQLSSSYEDEEEIENTISADLSFRLPNEQKNTNKVNRLDEEPSEEQPSEETVEEKTKAFRVDYECKVEKNTPFEMEEEYGHGRRDRYSYMSYNEPPMPTHNDFTCVFGSFYVYKDLEGNLLDPDFATEGRHQVVGNGGYQDDWYYSWDW